jgi:hypothetical protein
MIDLECPNCGRMGAVPNDKVNSRLVCKKCHMVFHVTPTGRAMKGEPPPAVKEKGGHSDRKADAHAHCHGHAHANPGLTTATKERDWAEGLFDFNRVQVMGGLLLVAILGLGGLVVMAGGSKDDLAKKTQDLANAVSAGDLATVKGFAWSQGADAVQTWYDGVHAQVADLSKDSAAHDVLTSVFVIEQNHARQQGQSIISFAPAVGSSREQAIAKAAGSAATTADKAIRQILTIWVLDRGSWKLDGPKTVALLPAPAPPAPAVGAAPKKAPKAASKKR